MLNVYSDQSTTPAGQVIQTHGVNCHKAIVVLGINLADCVIHGASGSSSSHHPPASSTSYATSS